MAIRRRPATAVAITACIAVAALLPWILEPYSLTQVSAWLYLSVAVLSLVLLVGLCGQISIGHAAFMGIGAYTATILSSDLAWPFWLACLAAVGLSALAGLVVSLAALRLTGLYIALPTIGLAIVFPTWIQAGSEWTGGTAGKELIADIYAPIGSGLTDEQWIYYLSLAVTAVVFIAVAGIRASRVGRALQAVRDHEGAAETFGVNPARTKVSAFMASAAIAGVAGCMFALQRQFVSPSDFSLVLAISLFTGMAVGGQRSLFGALVGGLFLEYVPSFIEDTGLDPVWTPLLYGAVLIAIMIWFRDGIAGGIDALIRRWRHSPAEPAASIPDRPAATHDASDSLRSGR